MSRQRTSTRRIVAPSRRARVRLSEAEPHGMPSVSAIAAAGGGAGGAAVATESRAADASESAGTDCARPHAAQQNESARANFATLALTPSLGLPPSAFA